MAVTGQVTVTDIAGNTASASVTVNLDKTPPTVTFGSATPAPNAAGWNNTNVAIPFTATDNLSGVAGTTPAVSPLVLITGGTAVTGTVTVTDVAGNSASVTVTVNIDKTPPEAVNQFDPATQDVVLFGRDALSGVPTGPIAPVSVVPTRGGREDDDDDAADERGQAELRTYQVQDRAGNTLRVVESVKREGHELKAQIVSLQYQSGPVLTPPPNKKAFEWAFTQAGLLKELEQKIKVGKGKDKQEVKAKFEGKKNETTIKVEDPKPETKVVQPGLVLLRLATSNGTLVIEF